MLISRSEPEETAVKVGVEALLSLYLAVKPINEAVGKVGTDGRVVVVGLW